ncbi:type II toxin-antitoxin system HicB family antitoxin [Stenomitos frigidus]|uniref:Type II toxin-antitoxin system HicB family antitoxin n=1 Tax=Stenomitos frigidus ULC18 TaxID=2107698 RepID=A0A2T1E517_9CYAN|nr:hypothetical protein [Stenomitos frigidus]PSB27795.1 hypothetical protein C7B82_15540 [Stenomitos frigidus ULC18]
MAFYTLVLRQSAGYWVALCLENGIVGQGETQNQAMQALQDAIDSVQSVKELDQAVYAAPLSIGELHEFLSIESQEPTSTTYELRTVHA